MRCRLLSVFCPETWEMHALRRRNVAFESQLFNSESLTRNATLPHPPPERCKTLHFRSIPVLCAFAPLREISGRPRNLRRAALPDPTRDGGDFLLRPAQ